MSPGQLVAGLGEDLLDRARALLGSRRAILGIAGSPGAGKSTLAARVVDAMGDQAVLVPMDGFHLHDDILATLGLSGRKGAPETFDVAGYAHLLGRLRDETDVTVYAPAFDRSRELSLAAAIAVEPRHRLVVTEGNYLLHDAQGWSSVLPLLDESWFVQSDDDVRRARLVQRHIDHGRPPDEARRWATVSDQANAEVVQRTRKVADVVVDVD